MQETQAQRVVGKFGGHQQMVADTDHPYKRIWNWLQRGVIPQEYHQGLLDDAARLRRDLLPYDFVAHLHRPVVSAEPLTATG